MTSHDGHDHPVQFIDLDHQCSTTVFTRDGRVFMDMKVLANGLYASAKDFADEVSVTLNPLDISFVQGVQWVLDSLKETGESLLSLADAQESERTWAASE